MEVSMKNTLRINKIKPTKGKSIIEKRKPHGLYYLYVDGIYIGIDNSTGHTWTEEFQDLKQCKNWLRDSSAINETESLGNGDIQYNHYNVTITETLKLTVVIEASNKEEAEQIVSDAWRNSDYILDNCAFNGVTFEATLIGTQ